jgi:hypothetical protein
MKKYTNRETLPLLKRSNNKYQLIMNNLQNDGEMLNESFNKKGHIFCDTAGLGEGQSHSDYNLWGPSLESILYQLALIFAFAPSWATWDTC